MNYPGQGFGAPPVDPNSPAFSHYMQNQMFMQSMMNAQMVGGTSGSFMTGFRGTAAGFRYFDNPHQSLNNNTYNPSALAMLTGWDYGRANLSKYDQSRMISEASQRVWYEAAKFGNNVKDFFRNPFGLADLTGNRGFIKTSASIQREADVRESVEMLSRNFSSPGGSLALGYKASENIRSKSSDMEKRIRNLSKEMGISAIDVGTFIFNLRDEGLLVNSSSTSDADSKIKKLAKQAISAARLMRTTITESMEFMRDLRQQGFDPSSGDMTKLFGHAASISNVSGLSRSAVFSAMQRGMGLGQAFGINPFSMGRMSAELLEASQSADFTGKKLYMTGGREGLVRTAESAIGNLANDASFQAFTLLKKSGSKIDRNEIFKTAIALRSGNLPEHLRNIDLTSEMAKPGFLSDNVQAFFDNFKNDNPQALRGFLNKIGVGAHSQDAFLALFPEIKKNEALNKKMISEIISGEIDNDLLINFGRQNFNVDKKQSGHLKNFYLDYVKNLKDILENEKTEDDFEDKERIARNKDFFSKIRSMDGGREESFKLIGQIFTPNKDTNEERFKQLLGTAKRDFGSELLDDISSLDLSSEQGKLLAAKRIISLYNQEEAYAAPEKGLIQAIKDSTKQVVGAISEFRDTTTAPTNEQVYGPVNQVGAERIFSGRFR